MENKSLKNFSHIDTEPAVEGIKETLFPSPGSLPPSPEKNLTREIEVIEKIIDKADELDEKFEEIKAHMEFFETIEEIIEKIEGNSNL